MGKFRLTVGADPEYFFSTKEGEQVKVVPACGLFGGSKRAPVFISSEGGFLEDGCAVEFNVSPSDSLGETKNKLERLHLIFSGMFPKYNLLPFTSSVLFNRKELKAHAQANIIGCDGDIYAYGIRDKPQISSFKNYRFAGGHIHIGIDPWPEELDKKLFVRYLDMVLYSPFVAYADQARFPFYGHLGLYREKDYGVEYRSPDNFWAMPSKIASASEFPRMKANADNFIRRSDLLLQEFVKALETFGPSRVAYKLKANFDDGTHFVELFSARKSRASPYGFNSSTYDKYGLELHKDICR